MVQLDNGAEDEGTLAPAADDADALLRAPPLLRRDCLLLRAIRGPSENDGSPCFSAIFVVVEEEDDKALIGLNAAIIILPLPAPALSPISPLRSPSDFEVEEEPPEEGAGTPPPATDAADEP